MELKLIIKTVNSGIYFNKYIQINPGFITLNFIEFCLDKGVHFKHFIELKELFANVGW